ncbi:MAG: HAD family hydrolase [Bdellovibrionota bacterium]
MKNLKYKHVIFDWNGTLLNDARICYEPCAEIFKELGMPHITFEEYKKNLSYPVIDFYIKYGFDTTKYDYTKISTKYHKRYFERLDECELFDDVIEILEFFKNYNVSLSILSALEQNMLIKCVKEKNITDYFIDIIGSDNDSAGSKIEKGLKWFEKKDFNDSEVLMIGDTLHDAEVAKNLNIDCFLVARGGQHKDVLETSSYKVFHSLKDIVSYIKNLD